MLWDIRGTDSHLGSPSRLDIFDFDGTLFKSPRPNPDVWESSSLGMLTDDNLLSNGGWWHDERTLTHAGSGIAEEGARGWRDHWNQNIVQKVIDSNADPKARSVLLTGRSSNFANAITQIVGSRNDLTFDLMALKPNTSKLKVFDTTIAFKLAFLVDIIARCSAEELKQVVIYEDRVSQATRFERFFEENEKYQNLAVSVVRVDEAVLYMDPNTESALVKKMIKEHNAAYEVNSGSSLRIKQFVVRTSYILDKVASNDIIHLFKQIVSQQHGETWKIISNLEIYIRQGAIPSHYASQWLQSPHSFRVFAFAYSPHSFRIRFEPVSNPELWEQIGRQPAMTVAHQADMRVRDALATPPVWIPISSDFPQIQFATTAVPIARYKLEYAK